jgi:alpha-amylase/alpha-mannosidase (GH57 family)
LLLLILIAVLAPLTGVLAPLRAKAQGSPEVYSNFTVTSTGYLTVYLYGVPPSSKVLLWWGIEPYPQGPWYTTSGESGNMETPMTYNSSTGAFEATIGPFKNGTWVAYVFNVNGTIWINYDNHPFWNWNVIINPPMNIIGYTKAWVLPNGSIVITTIGRPPDEMILWWGLTTGPQTGLPWYTTAGTPGANQTVMTYNPLWGNYTAIIGPFKPGQWVQWVYHDAYTGWWIHNSNVSPGANFAIQDVYLPVQLVSARYSQLAYTVGQQAEVQLTLNNTYATSTYDVALVVGTTTVYNSSVTLPEGCSNLSITFPVNFPMGFYDSYLYVGTSGMWKEFQLPQLIVLNTTGRKPISVVIVWNMHQPLYLEPNGTWGQPWVQIHTGQDLYWNGSLVGAYELQAMLLNEFPNINVTIDFTPVLLYQWEAFLHQSSPTFLTTGVNVTHDKLATEETIALYRKLVQEGRLQVLTVPFYHPLMAIEYDNGWQSDLLAQLLMGENMTYTVFGVNATGAWTPEMAFNMGLPWLYADAGINVTILDYQAFVQMAPALTVVSGNLSLGPYGIYVVQNSLGQRMYVLFRDDDLSNMFGFLFFYHQSPQEVQQELIDYLAKVYMEHPGAVVVVALDGENPLIFNQEPQAAENLYAIYQALSEAEDEGWLVTQTVNQAIETHPVAAVLTNLPEESWALNLNNWNNGYAGKVYIWDNVSLAREYLVAFSNLLGMPISPVVPLSFAHAPNASVAAFEAMTGMPAYINVSGVTEANPLYMYYTMWNWLYVSEGSDWTWQAGPPNYGPQWFSVQPIVYDSAIVGYVRQAFSKVTPIKVEPGPGHDSVKLTIRDDLGVPFHLKIKVIVVVSNGTANASAEVTLHPGNNVVILKGIRVTPHSQVQVYIYAPVRPSQLGGHVMPISRYGLLMSSKTFKANKPQASMSPAAWLNGLLNYYYAWVAAVIAIMVTIASALAGHLRL